MENKIIIISGPSTIGKNPLLNEMCKKFNYSFIVPYTTRLKRPEEINTIDYHFLKKIEFIDNVKSNFFEDWDYVLNNFYGFDKSFINKQNNLVTHCLSRMAIRLKQKNPNIRLFFFKPTNKNDFINKLSKIYKGKDLELRLLHLEDEIALSEMFDFVFENDNALYALQNSEFLKNILTEPYLNNLELEP